MHLFGYLSVSIELCVIAKLNLTRYTSEVSQFSQFVKHNPLTTLCALALKKQFPIY